MLLRHLYRSTSSYSPCLLLRRAETSTLHNSARPTHCHYTSQASRTCLLFTFGNNRSAPLTISILVTVSLLLGGSLILRNKTSAEIPLDAGRLNTLQDYTETLDIQLGMSASVPPGRPGNLTPDQEAKLQELWAATLRVFGVTPPTNKPNGVDSLGEAEQKSKVSASGTEKKKKRVSMFGKKNRHDGTENTATEGSIDSDDKYGQTKEFHSILANQSPEDLRKAFWSMVKHDHPDGLLLRFLRARKWDVHNALIMMVATMSWRLQEMHVDDDIMIKGEGGAVSDESSSNAAVKKEASDFLAQMRLGKSFLHGTDKEGRPMTFIRAKLHKQGEQSQASLERYTVLVIETARLMLSPPVDTAVCTCISLVSPS